MISKLQFRYSWIKTHQDSKQVADPNVLEISHWSTDWQILSENIQLWLEGKQSYNIEMFPSKEQYWNYHKDTVDGRNPANQLRLVVYPIIYKVLYIPGGCLGFLPPMVSRQNEGLLRGPWLNFPRRTVRSPPSRLGSWVPSVKRQQASQRV